MAAKETIKKGTAAPAKSPETVANSKKLLAVIGAINKIAEKNKEDTPFINVGGDMEDSHPHISTGSLVLDYLIGGKPNSKGIAPCPGVPKGKLTNVYGAESSGKTTFCLTVAAQVCAAGGTVMFIDWEHALDLNYAESLGVPVADGSRFSLAQPATLDEGLRILQLCAQAGVDLVILDSVSAGVPAATVNKSLSEVGQQARVGLVAAMWAQTLPTIVGLAKKSGCTILGISQLRQKIATGPGAGRGETTTVSGGNAWKFYSSLRIRFTKIQSEKSKVYSAVLHKVEEQVTTNIILAKIEKCKVAPSAHNVANFFIRFGAGIDDVRSAVDIASRHGIVRKKGAWFEWDRPQGQIRGNGMTQFMSFLASTPGAEEEIRELAHIKLGDAVVKDERGDTDDDENELDVSGLLDVSFGDEDEASVEDEE